MVFFILTNDTDGGMMYFELRVPFFSCPILSAFLCALIFSVLWLGVNEIEEEFLFCISVSLFLDILKIHLLYRCRAP